MSKSFINIIIAIHYRPPTCDAISYVIFLACIIQGRLPLTGTTVTRHAEDADNAYYAFDITGLHLIQRNTIDFL